MDKLTKQLQVSDTLARSLGLDDLMWSVAKTIEVPLYDNSPWLQARIGDILSTITELEQQVKESRRFPVFNAQRSVSQTIQGLRKSEMHLRMALKGYPALMDPTFLTWNKKGTNWPAFMVLGLDSQFTTLRVRGNYTRYECFHEPEIAGFLTKQFDAFYQYLAFNFSSIGEQESFITAEFSGLPGPNTISRIEKALAAVDVSGEPLFHDILLIAEAGDWKRGGVALSSLDPYVVGVREDTDQIYFIDIFNPSDLELSIIDHHLRKIH